MAWKDVLDAVKTRLAPADWETFQRLHRAFAGYPTEGTLARFYGFVFSRGLQTEIGCYRFERMEKIIAGLAARPPLSSPRVLDVGAGAGFIAAAALGILSPREYVAQDLCAGARDHLAAEGFKVLPHPVPIDPPGGPFDLILCADSLGEINSDEDGYLRDTANFGAEEFGEAIEDRYGFAQKLEPWRRYLAPAGSLLLWEPFSHASIWEPLARHLGAQGWNAGFDASADCLELSLR